MYKRVRRIATGIILILLLALFTLPRAYLSRVCRGLSTFSAGAAQAVQLNGDPAPQLARMKQLYEKSAPVLRLFLDHGSVDAIGAAVASCVSRNEPEELLTALNVLEAALKHAKNIEALSADSLF